MPITVIIPSGEIVNSQINSNAGIDRAKLAAEQLKDNIPLELLRVWDAFQTSIPTTASSDDLGLIIGTFGTDAIVVQTSDAKNTTMGAISCAWAMRPMGWRATKFLRACTGSASELMRSCSEGVSTVPGQMALQRMPLATKSAATLLVKPMTAALEAP